LSIARSQQGRAEILLGFVVNGEERQQRQIAAGIVLVEEGELLRAVRRVIGRIEIDRDVSGPAMEPPLVALDLCSLARPRCPAG
jgi:hypothetical protein